MDPKNYGYFMGILIIDPNRPGPEKNRPEPEPKISKYLLGLNIQDPKRSGPERNRPEPDPKTRTPRPNNMIDICLFIILWLLYKFLVTFIKNYEIYGIWLTDYYNIFILIFGSNDLIPTVIKKKIQNFYHFQTAINSVFHL